MSDELWNQKLTRENIRDFYMSTVVMVYSSCYGITKEATRCENAIIKSYLDIYSKRNNIAGDRVIYECCPVSASRRHDFRGQTS